MIKFKLAEILEKQEKTMYWLSKESGVRPNTISQWVNNEDVKSISVETLNKICKTLKCNIADIVDYVDDDE